MTEQVEILSLDLRYECCRMKSAVAEKILLESIISHGIRDPLQGVNTRDGQRILLNGFKRVRCAKKLNIGIVPFRSLGDDEPLGILELLRISNEKSLSILEQARLIDELRSVYHMPVADIALLLEKSKAWVSVRSGIIKEMSPIVMEKLFSGAFPVYAYMYTIRQFMRINGIGKKEVDEFVKIVSGRNLSIRDIEMLAHGYFKGSSELRGQIEKGHIEWGLEKLKPALSTGCSGIEEALLKELDISQKYMRRIILKSKDSGLKTAPFCAQAHLLAGGILRQIAPFTQAIEGLHDRSGQKTSHIHPS